MDIYELRQKLGKYYLEKNEGDYLKCKKDLYSLRITETKIEDGRFSIALWRPGILIGPRGQNIEELQKYMGVPVHIVENVGRDPYWDIIPTDPDEEYW